MDVNKSHLSEIEVLQEGLEEQFQNFLQACTDLDTFLNSTEYLNDEVGSGDTIRLLSSQIQEAISELANLSAEFLLSPLGSGKEKMDRISDFVNRANFEGGISLSDDDGDNLYKNIVAKIAILSTKASEENHLPDASGLVEGVLSGGGNPTTEEGKKES